MYIHTQENKSKKLGDQAPARRPCRIGSRPTITQAVPRIAGQVGPSSAALLRDADAPNATLASGRLSTHLLCACHDEHRDEDAWSGYLLVNHRASAPRSLVKDTRIIHNTRSSEGYCCSSELPVDSVRCTKVGAGRSWPERKRNHPP
jgi:hypothetical protein